MIVSAAGTSAGQATTKTSNSSQSGNPAAQQFAQSMNKASTAGTGSPESAQNGGEAAQDLLSTTNSYFYDPSLYRHEPGYNPEKAKAQSFAATLSDYERNGDSADIAQLLNALGPARAARFFAEAGNLQGQQFNDSGLAYTPDQVLGQALAAPGVSLGNDTQQGTLAYDLLQ